MKWRELGAVFCLSLVLLLATGGCQRRDSDTAPATGDKAVPAARGRAAVKGIGMLPPPMLAEGEAELPSKIAEVCWTVEPAGATVRIESPRGVVTLLTTQDAPVPVPLLTDFYEVSITHPDCEPWSKRLGLGGTATNQVVALTRLPAKPMIEESASAPAVVTTPAAVVAQVEAAADDDEPPPPVSREGESEAVVGAVAVVEVAAVVEEPVVEAEAPAAVVAAVVATAVAAPEVAEDPAPETVAKPEPVAITEEPLAAVVAAAAALPEAIEVVEDVVADAAEPLEEVLEEPPGEIRFVRIVIESSAAGDYALPHVIKHLHLADGTILPLDDPARPFELASLGEGPIALRVDLYDVEPPFQELSQAVPGTGTVGELRFKVRPQPAKVRFVEIPAIAEIWNRTDGLPGERLGFAGQEISLAPFVPHRLEVRLPGYQPSSLDLRVAHPTEDLGEIAPVLMPPPRFAKAGQCCSVVLAGGIDMNFVWVPGGRFVMTDPRFVGEFPDVRVETVPQGFWMAERETSRAEWAALMGSGTATVTDPLLPQSKVSWIEACEFAARLGNLIPDALARLPEEGEWEFAALAAGQVSGSGSGAGDIYCLPGVAGRPRATGEGRPNALGLLNMLGKVREWCDAAYAPYRSGAPADPALRVVRGGGFGNAAVDCHPQVRDALPADARADDVGFRVIFQIQPLMRVKK